MPCSTSRTIKRSPEEQPDQQRLYHEQDPDVGQAAVLVVELLTTDEHLQAYADLNSRAYELPLEDGRDGLARSALWKDQVYAYLGVRDGIAVTCAATVEAAGRLFVILVATDPRWQRRGYGEAVTRKALYEGARATGLTRATNQALSCSVRPAASRTTTSPSPRCAMLGGPCGTTRRPVGSGRRCGGTVARWTRPDLASLHWSS